MNLEEKAILADQVIEPFDLVQLQQNIGLTCNSGPKGLAWFVPSVATAQTMTIGIVRLKQLLDEFF